MTAVLLLFCALGTDIYGDFHARGNGAYDVGDYSAAIAAYEHLAASGVWEPELYVNLGNAHYHQGDLGRAVLNYERALGVDPRHEGARRNLALTVDSTTNRLERPPGFATSHRAPSWIPGITQTGFRVALVALWWALWGILAFRKRSAALSRVPVPLLVLLLVLCLAALAVPAPPGRAAVVVAPSTPLRYGPDPLDPVRRDLDAGDRVVVDLEEGGWARVEIAGGERGWVDSATLAFAGPPFPPTKSEGVPTSP